MSPDRLLLFVLLLFLPIVGFSQVLDYVDVHLRIVEKVGPETRALANSKVRISDQGEGFTDAQGRYDFTYAVRKNVDPEIKVSLFSGAHKMLKPLDGSLEIDTSREELSIELLVVNMAEESEAFQRRIKGLEKKISALQARNEFTKRQLDEMNRRLVDTIMYFESLRQAMESEIAGYEKLTEEQSAEIEAQRARISELEDEVSSLTVQLEAALEERYLRQNQIFKDISSNLLGYLRSAKDIRDQLPYINTYFASGSYDEYARAINGYSEEYEKFDNNRPAYLEGVEHYWENRAILKRLDNLFDYIAKGIHYDQVYRLTMELKDELAKQRPKKAQKIADLAYEDLFLNLSKLEKDINRTLADLRNNL